MRYRMFTGLHRRISWEWVLWVQVDFFKERGLEEFADADAEALAQFMDNSQLYGIIGAMNQIADGGFWNTALGKQLILGHPMLRQKLLQPQADCLVQFHIHHRL